MTTILQRQTYHLFGRAEISSEANIDLVIIKTTKLFCASSSLPIFSSGYLDSMGYHPIVYPIPTLIPSPLFVKKPYTSPFSDVQIITLGSAMYIKVYFINQCSTIKLTNSEK